MAVAQPLPRVLRSQLGNEDAALIAAVLFPAMAMAVAQPIPRVLRSQLGNEDAVLILQYPTAKSSCSYSVALLAMI